MLPWIAALVLLAASADATEADDLFDAATHGDAQKAERLLSKGADTERRMPDHGSTALIVAGYHGGVDVVTLLLAKGANIEATDINGCTSLIYASRNGHAKVVNLLVAKGADIEAKGNNGHTALIEDRGEFPWLCGSGQDATGTIASILRLYPQRCRHRGKRRR